MFKLTNYTEENITFIILNKEYTLNLNIVSLRIGKEYYLERLNSQECYLEKIVTILDICEYAVDELSSHLMEVWSVDYDTLLSILGGLHTFYKKRATVTMSKLTTLDIETNALTEHLLSKVINKRLHYVHRIGSTITDTVLDMIVLSVQIEQCYDQYNSQNLSANDYLSKYYNTLRLIILMS